MTCHQCKFFCPHAVFADRGYCRRYPPPTGLNHPIVYLLNWCGEFTTPQPSDQVPVPIVEVESEPGPIERVKAPRRKRGPNIGQ